MLINLIRFQSLEVLQMKILLTVLILPFILCGATGCKEWWDILYFKSDIVPVTRSGSKPGTVSLNKLNWTIQGCKVNAPLVMALSTGLMSGSCVVVQSGGLCGWKCVLQNNIREKQPFCTAMQRLAVLFSLGRNQISAAAQMLFECCCIPCCFQCRGLN